MAGARKYLGEFESIESAQDYLRLLSETIAEVRGTFEADLCAERQTTANPERFTAALQLVAYNLSKFAEHIRVSRRILNDLRTLRRLLLTEGKRDVVDRSGICHR